MEIENEPSFNRMEFLPLVSCGFGRWSPGPCADAAPACLPSLSPLLLCARRWRTRARLDLASTREVRLGRCSLRLRTQHDHDLAGWPANNANAWNFYGFEFARS